MDERATVCIFVVEDVLADEIAEPVPRESGVIVVVAVQIHEHAAYRVDHEK